MKKLFRRLNQVVSSLPRLSADPSTTSQRSLEIDALEPRVLFSGAPVEVADSDADSDTTAETASATPETSSGQTASDTATTTLTNEALEIIANSAAERWRATGLSAEQSAALDSITYEITNLNGIQLGQTSGMTIVLDDDAAGVNWFIDATPDADEEFGENGQAISGDAANRVDLLSIVLHEQGHILGLPDTYLYGSSSSPDLMYGIFEAGERRLPATGQASGFVAGSLEGINLAVISYSTGGAVTVSGTTVGGTPYVQGPFSFISNTAATPLADGSFNALATTTSGTGTGMLLDVAISGGTATVTLDSLGRNYVSGDTITINGALIGGVSGANDLVLTINVVPDALVFGGAAGNSPITFDDAGDDNVVIAGIEFTTDDNDPSGPDKIVIEGGGQISMLEDGNNNHNEFLAASYVQLGTLPSGQTIYIINEDDNDILYFRGTVDVQGNDVIISGGNASAVFKRLSSGGNFVNGASDEDIRFELTSSIIGSGTITVQDDAYVRLYAANPNFSGNWIIDATLGNPHIELMTNTSSGHLGTGSVTLQGSAAELRLGNNTVLVNDVFVADLGNEKYILVVQGTSATIDSAVTINVDEGSVDDFTGRLRFAVGDDVATNYLNSTLTVDGLITGNGIFKQQNGLLVLTNANNSYSGVVNVNTSGSIPTGDERDAGLIIDGGVVRVTSDGALGAVGSGVVLYGDTSATNDFEAALELADGVVISNHPLFVEDPSQPGDTSALRLQLGATSAEFRSEIYIENDNPGGFDLFAGAGGTLTVSGVISDFDGESAEGTGGAGIEKMGFGTVVLTAVNTFSGPVTVTEGALALNGGSLATVSDVTVASGTAFGGNGSIAGNVVYSAGSTLKADLLAASGTSLSVGGTTTLGGAMIELNVPFSTFSAAAPGQEFIVAQNVTGTLASGTDNITQGGLVFSVDYTGGDGNDLVLTVLSIVDVETEVQIDGSGNLVISDINGGTSDDTLSVSQGNGFITISDPNNRLEAIGADGINIIQVSASTVQFRESLVTSGIIYNGAAGTDTLTLNNLSLPGAINLAADTIVLSGNLTAASGGISLTADLIQVQSSNATLDTSADGSAIILTGDVQSFSGTQGITFNTGTGSATITGGTSPSSLGSLTNVGTGTIVVDNDLFVDASGLSLFGAGSGNSAFTINGEITGNGTIILDDDAYVTVTGNNSSFAGDWFIDATVGDTRLIVQNVNALGAAAVTVSNTASRLAFDVDGSFANTITMNNTGNEKYVAVEAGHVVELTGDINLNENGAANYQRFVVAADAQLTISGKITETAGGDGFYVTGGNANSRLILTNPANTILLDMNVASAGQLVFTSSGAAGALLASKEIHLQNTDSALVLSGTDFASNPLGIPVYFDTGGNEKYLRFENGTDAEISGLINVLETGAGFVRVDLDGGQTLTLSGSVTGTGGAGLKTVGSGTVVLTNATNPITGTVDVATGTLLLGNGAALTAATVNVGTGATFGGNGTVSQAITFAQGSSLQVDVDASGSPLLDVASGQNVNGALLVINVTGLPASFPGTPLVILSDITGTFANVPGSGTLISGGDGNNYTVDYVGNNVVISAVASQVATTTVSLSGTTLRIEDTDGTVSNRYEVSVEGSNLVIRDTAGLINDTTGIGGVSGSGTYTLSVPLSGFTGLEIVSAGGTDTVNLLTPLDLGVGTLSVTAESVTISGTVSAGNGITINGETRVVNGSTLDTSANNGAIIFNGTVNAISESDVLVVDAGSGAVSFNGNVGDVTPFAGYTNLGSGTATFANGTSVSTRNDLTTFNGEGSGNVGTFLILGTIGSGQTGTNAALRADNDARVIFGNAGNAATINLADGGASGEETINTRNGGRFEFINLSGSTTLPDGINSAEVASGAIIIGDGSTNPVLEVGTIPLPSGQSTNIDVSSVGFGIFEFYSGILNLNTSSFYTGNDATDQAGTPADRITIGGGSVEAWLNLNATNVGDWNTTNGKAYAEILANGHVTLRNLNLGSNNTITDAGLDLLINGGTLDVTGNIDFRTGTADTLDKIRLESGVINGNADGVSDGQFLLRDTTNSNHVFEFVGGTVKGFSQFTGNLTQDGGTLQVGIDTSNGSLMTVTGNYALNTGTLSLTLGDKTSNQADRLTVSGTGLGNVTLGAGALLDLSQGSAYTTGTGTQGSVITLLSYTGTLTGEFSNYANGQEFTIGTDVYTIDYGLGAASAITLTLQRVDDTTAPAVNDFAPADNGIDVDPTSNLVITFDEPVYPVTGSGEIRLVQTGVGTVETWSFAGGLPAGVTITGNTVTIDPTADLASNTAYHIEISGSANAGNTQAVFANVQGLGYEGTADATVWNFTSVDVNAPTTLVEVVGGQLVIEDIAPLNTNDVITISQVGNIITIQTVGQPLSVGAGAVAGGDIFTATIDATGVTNGVLIRGQAGTDTVTINSLNVTGGLSFEDVESVTLDGSVVTTGSLVFDDAAAIFLSGSVDTGTGNQTYTVPVTLTGTTALAGGTISFAGAVDSDGTARALATSASVEVVFNGNVGALSALDSLDTSGSAATIFADNLAVTQTSLTLNWDASLDRGTGQFWDSTINATVLESTFGNRNAWDWAGTDAGQVDVSGSSNLAAITRAFAVGSAGNTGATLNSFENEMSNVRNGNDSDWSNENFAIEIVFRPTAAMLTGGPYVLWESGGNQGTTTDSSVIYLQDGNVVFEVRDSAVAPRRTATLALPVGAENNFQQLIAFVDVANNDVAKLWLNGGSGMGGTEVVSVETGAYGDWTNGSNSGLGRANDGVGITPYASPANDFVGEIAIVRAYRNVAANYGTSEVETNWTALNTTRVSSVTVTTAGAQTYGTNVTLGADTTLSGASVTFNGSVNDDGNGDTLSGLTVNTTSGNVIFGGSVGGTAELTSLTTGAAGTVQFNTGGSALQVFTMADQSYSGNVETVSVGATEFRAGSILFGGTTDFGADTSIKAVGLAGVWYTSEPTFVGTATFAGDSIFNGTASVTAESFSFGGTLGLGSGDSSFLAINDGTFSGLISGAGANVNVQVADITNFAGGLDVASVTTYFGGYTMLGGNVTLSGSQDNLFGNQLLVTAADVTIDATSGTGGIAFVSTIDGADGLAANLTINANGAIQFGGNIGDDSLNALSADAGLGSLSIGGSGTVTVMNNGSGYLNSLNPANQDLYFNYVASLDPASTNLWEDLVGRLEDLEGSSTVDYLSSGNFGDLDLTANGAPVAVTDSAHQGIHAAFNTTAIGRSLEEMSDNLSDEDISVELWVRLNANYASDTTARVVWETGSSGASQPGMSVSIQGSMLTLAAQEDDDRLSPAVGAGTRNAGGLVTVDLSTLGIDLTDFIQIMVVFDVNGGSGTSPNNDIARLYVNGTEQASIDNVDMDDISSGDDIGLGQQSGTTGGYAVSGDRPTAAFNGQTAIYRVWRQALTANEVQAAFDLVHDGVKVTTSGAVTISNNVVLNSTLTTNGGAPSIISGDVSGTGGINQQGVARLELNGANSYTGDTIVASGRTLILGDGTAASTSSLTGAVTNEGNLVVNLAASGTATLSGDLSGAGTLTILEGTTELSGTNTNTGLTAVNGGTLRMNANQTSGGTATIVVASGATLEGEGNTDAVVTIDSGGFLAPGIGAGDVGILTLGNLDLDGTFVINILGSGGVAGVDFDQIIIQGLNTTVDLSNTTVEGTIVDDGGSITVIDQQGTNSTSFIGLLPGIAEGDVLLLDGRSQQVSYAGNDLTLTAVNDAPVLGAGVADFDDVGVVQFDNDGDLVSTLINGQITDVDSGSLEGIAVTGTMVTGAGKFQYSTDGGTSWNDIGAVSDSSALLLLTTDRIRFVPDGATTTDSTMTFRAWDQTGVTTGLEHTTVDTSVNGGISPFSADARTVNVSISELIREGNEIIYHSAPGEVNTLSVHYDVNTNELVFRDTTSTIGSGFSGGGTNEVRIVLNPGDDLTIETGDEDDTITLGDLGPFDGNLIVDGEGGQDHIILDRADSTLAPDASASFTGEEFDAILASLTTQG
ncbi:MAG: Ig-like domain-containing protein, partial [Verrucomicrobiae bacterium]|nr:Ig-like domain-containing protein [Verrucomicrobiae bacterium]